MTGFSTQSFTQSLRAQIRDHACALDRIYAGYIGDLNIDHQMSAVRIMAEAILDLRALNLPLMSPPPLPVHSMLHLAIHTNDPQTFQSAIREFAGRTQTILEMEESLSSDNGSAF